MSLLTFGYQPDMTQENLSANEFYTKGKQASTHFLSNIPPQDCLLCGDSKETLLPLYKGENNIGIISLNTFSLAYIGINQYDDLGNLIEEPSHGSSTHITSTKENGFSLSICENINRGYAEGHLYFNNDEFLDPEKTASLLCQDCLDQIIDDGWRSPSTGLGIINFNTGQIRPLKEKVAAFQLNDFYISCRSARYPANHNALEMNLLIFYCPERYSD